MNAALPLITVFGATGRQGGSVVRALLAQGGCRVRAVMRQPQSAAARWLAASGAELCRADFDDPASLERALDGASGAFCMTSCREHGDARRELRQARHLADAAASAGIRRLVWSTQEDTRPAGLHVPAMDAKAEANAFFLAHELPVSLLLTSFHWDDLVDAGFAQRHAGDGVLELTLPLGDALLPGMAAADIGACAAALLDLKPAQRRVGVAGEHLSGLQMAAVLADALGEPVRWRDALPDAAPPELAAMFAFMRQANAACCAARPVAATRALHPGLLDFRTWLQGQLPRLRAAIQTHP
jgi:uncharacterized protein YbjT (DUF2867 family)